MRLLRQSGACVHTHFVQAAEKPLMIWSDKSLLGLVLTGYSR